MRTLTTTLYSGLAALSLLVPTATHAETTVATVPQGYVTLTVSAGTGTFAKLSILYAPLHSTSTAAGILNGQITAFATSTVTNSSAGWTDSQLASATAPTFIKITSGAATGHTFQITANTSNALTVDTQGLDLTTLGILAGDTYQIFAGDTILSLFGTPSAENLIIGGTSSHDAVDLVMLYNGSAWIPYYYNTTAGAWRQGTSPTNKGSTYIRPDCAFIYSRIGNTPLTFTVTGEVPTTQAKMVVNTNGNTPIASFFPTDQTLGSLNIQSLPGWKKVGDAGVATSANADKVLIHNGSAWIPYFYNGTAGQWRQGTSPTDKASIPVPVGAGILIQRTGTTGRSVLTLSTPSNYLN